MARFPLWAHRGATSPGVPENSLAALRAAVAIGADGVELDVRLTTEGEIRLSHDVLGPEVGGLATLAHALDACVGLTVNVELKDLPHEPGFARIAELIEAVAAIVNARDVDVVVSSFHLPTLDHARAVFPDAVRTGWLTLPGADLGAAAALAAGAGHQAIHPHLTSAVESGVRAALDLGLAVHVWTVNDPAEAVRLAAIGASAVITDDVPTLRAALAP